MGNAQSSGDSRSISTASSYPTVKANSNNSNRRRPAGPNPYNFFDGHMEATSSKPPPARKPSSATASSHSSTPSSSVGTTVTQKSSKTAHINFFEVAAITPEPLPQPKKSSSNSPSTRTPASSIQKSYTQTSSLFNTITPTTSRSSNTSSSLHCTLAKSNCLMIDGRKYYKNHALNRFMLPCDDEEADRLTALHYILKVMFQWNFISPVHDLLASEKKHRVLDIGCGPGTWTLEMATEYPNADFYGIDECPIFPTTIKPPNAHFQTHNILKGPLPFENEQFDFIYMRSMMLYLSPVELSNLLSEIHRIMKPGSYFEVIDTDYTIRRAGPLSNSIINTELKQRVNPVYHVNTMESNTQHPLFAFLTVSTPQQPTISFLGHFIDISQDHVALPLGYWTEQQLDCLHTDNFKKFLSSLHVPDKTLGKQEVNAILEECERYKSYLNWFICYARKSPKQDKLKHTLDSIDEFVQGFIDI
ncbi:hypothetical protein G6F46_001400 [Rhizopus delemar]|uniref:Methyltransferase domain-containing protein n=2 Tax=Rhizopus TaxID=4842 RepID=A0A9P6ZCH1_9FUNG|nr:hypothetical protein G6F55_006840 [Rhizopus delemar]KAG1547053.1 hypothetical protein G6F51_004504 [Rhizopus arrhizus]KAG1501836.1 hypothetical protein G6F54_002767 [Rhizopus delemar]KAG1517991.1 hypothetical protein G6F53_000935 [Rhizopus delemar]KAG1527525.1 hypothetical protein G6F52_001458 [Rhizopus delemar]